MYGLSGLLDEPNLSRFNRNWVEPPCDLACYCSAVAKSRAWEPCQECFQQPQLQARKGPSVGILVVRQMQLILEKQQWRLSMKDNTAEGVLARAVSRQNLARFLTRSQTSKEAKLVFTVCNPFSARGSMSSRLGWGGKKIYEHGSGLGRRMWVNAKVEQLTMLSGYAKGLRREKKWMCTNKDKGTVVSIAPIAFDSVLIIHSRMLFVIVISGDHDTVDYTCVYSLAWRPLRPLMFIQFSPMLRIESPTHTDSSESFTGIRLIEPCHWLRYSLKHDVLYGIQAPVSLPVKMLFTSYICHIELCIWSRTKGDVDATDKKVY
ncbi:hypothetical protein BC835DRAFT_1307432 [Cytidiella melzeri]|nr:hypothetical protein BC835DRAFT_1307432 [Cytidiella melzeri]